MNVIGDIKIHHWDEIKDEFHGADIFLANGFSIGIHAALDYRSLFDNFLKYLEPHDQVNFRKFNSTNFEGMQGRLTDAIEVSKIFGLTHREIDVGVHKLKHGLLSAIQTLHPRFSTIDPQAIYSRSQKLDWFEDIYTTNYDIFLYHILLATLDRHRNDGNVKQYQDFFRKAGSDLQFEPRSIRSFKNIFYLHGALFLYNESGRITKIKRGSRADELIDLIRLKINQASFPTFITEGKASLKKETIARSKYLSFCQAAFRANRNRLVVHGFSFSDSDNHLINDLNQNPRKLAIGFYLPGLSGIKLSQKVRVIASKLYKYPSKNLIHFDSKTLF
jgi:hypothetical protein